MATLGQKLEGARNRKGISIREAEESTKIRGHFLASFEQDNFDLNLPPVYLNGFVKNYARFLGLDTEAVLAELEAQLPTGSGKTDRKPPIGTLTSEEGLKKPAGESTGTSGSAPPGVGSPFQPHKPPSFLRPIIFISTCVLVLVAVIVGLVKFLADPDRTVAAPVDSNSSVSERGSTLGSSTGEPLKSQGEFSLRLAAFGPIERLILADDGAKPPQQKYYERRDLAQGWEETFILHQSFQCYVSALENIRYVVDEGKEFQPLKSGAGKIAWPTKKE